MGEGIDYTGTNMRKNVGIIELFCILGCGGGYVTLCMSKLIELYNIENFTVHKFKNKKYIIVRIVVSPGVVAETWRNLRGGAGMPKVLVMFF